MSIEFRIFTPMLLAFEHHLREQFPQLYHSRLLVAVSGGLDSVALTHLCKQLGLDISLAHCNFHLREEESDSDEEFVLELADSLELEVFVEHFDTITYAEEHKVSIQMAARELRYHWFEELRDSLDFDYIVTAHHANDNLETFLINLIRGTGLDGLTGIPLRNEFVLRPLLPFSRAEIEVFANNNKLEWKEDSSNASTKYMRNKIRHEVVPVLEELNPQLLESFQKTQSHLKQSSQMLEDYMSVVFPGIAREIPYGYAFNIRLMKGLPHLKGVLYELFRTFGFTEWADVYHLLDAQSGKMVLSKTHRLIKDREELLLTEHSEAETVSYEISIEEEVVMLPMGSFHLEEVQEVTEAERNVIFVDKNTLTSPLHVRKWKTGDYFYPFGMQGKKKLSKFFKDIKLSLPEKENCWLLCSRDQIVWVVGQRADERFAVKGETSELLKITYLS